MRSEAGQSHTQNMGLLRAHPRPARGLLLNSILQCQSALLIPLTTLHQSLSFPNPVFMNGSSCPLHLELPEPSAIRSLAATLLPCKPVQTGIKHCASIGRRGCPPRQVGQRRRAGRRDGVAEMKGGTGLHPALLTLTSAFP